MKIAFQYRTDKGYSRNQYPVTSNPDELKQFAEEAALLKVFIDDGETHRDALRLTKKFQALLNWQGEIVSIRARESKRVLGYQLWRTARGTNDAVTVFEAMKGIHIAG